MNQWINYHHLLYFKTIAEEGSVSKAAEKLFEYNSNEVLIKCVDKMKSIFDSKVWQINQPIVMSKIYTELDRVEGVQSVTSVRVVNLYNTTDGYSGNVYDITAATKAGVIYPSLDPSVFEVKYPNSDIVGKVVSL